MSISNDEISRILDRMEKQLKPMMTAMRDDHAACIIGVARMGDERWEILVRGGTNNPMAQIGLILELLHQIEAHPHTVPELTRMVQQAMQCLGHEPERHGTLQ